MCIIFAADDESSYPTLAELKEGERQNDDGAGMAWLEGGKVHYEKDLTAKYIDRKLQTLTGPTITHFRWASSGFIEPLLCHPFPLDNAINATEGVTGSVLFHNGTIDKSAWLPLMLKTDLAKLPDGNWSDSRALAYACATLKNPNLINLFSDSNRFAVMDKTGIELFGSWCDLRPGLQTSCTLWKLKTKKDGKVTSLINDSPYLPMDDPCQYCLEDYDTCTCVSSYLTGAGVSP